MTVQAGQRIETPHQPLSQQINILDTILLNHHVVVSKHPCHCCPLYANPALDPAYPQFVPLCPQLRSAKDDLYRRFPSLQTQNNSPRTFVFLPSNKKKLFARLAILRPFRQNTHTKLKEKEETHKTQWQL
jgi:hypothetical protein